MFAITGITGNVGGQVAQALLAAGQPVRAIVRDAAKGDAWATRECEVALADIYDSKTLAEAFGDAEGVFVMVPPMFDPVEGFPEAASVASSLRSALEMARPGKVVYLSTIGAQATQSNLLTQLTMIEKALRDLPVPITFLRPGWFMANAAWDVEPARTAGVVPSFDVGQSYNGGNRGILTRGRRTAERNMDGQSDCGTGGSRVASLPMMLLRHLHDCWGAR